jgi:hypothetical protein
LRFAGRLFPRVEMGEIAANDLPTKQRAELWLDRGPRVGDDAFIKLYTHGAREDNADALLGTANRAGGLEQMFRWLHEITQQRGIELHWASAYEMFRAVEAQTGPLMPSQNSGARLSPPTVGAGRS